MNHALILAALTAVSMASGQLLFKLGAQRLQGENLGQLIGSFLFNPYLMGAIFLYATTVLVWIYVLRVLPLSIAYPLTALSYIIVPILSLFILGEKVSTNTIIGSTLIIAGVMITHMQKA
ncbi:EamA family transporter [Pseudomonas sp. TTU2014-080ASC]|jgi:drug/metabolite transporter (DMT)-like permease|uniref:EamA family transporter n=1 Tax=Pseudomonas sp. TTU2014-080ASC TaxID=1729724 RepID=UPI0007188AD7|nr:EamA family transporter [Pseudomonas sp. TTU2014-080ASC]KRW60859.1 hypothetical protein AO726_05800 [Pseudomonas sp. TTU2014-080ASC]